MVIEKADDSFRRERWKMLSEERVAELKSILLAEGKEKSRLIARYLYLNHIDPIDPDDESTKIVWPDEEDTPSFEGLQLLVEVWMVPSLPVVTAEKLERVDGYFWVYMDSVFRDVLYRLGGEDASYDSILMEEDFI